MVRSWPQCGQGTDRPAPARSTTNSPAHAGHEKTMSSSPMTSGGFAPDAESCWETAVSGGAIRIVLKLAKPTAKRNSKFVRASGDLVSAHVSSPTGWEIRPGARDSDNLAVPRPKQRQVRDTMSHQAQECWIDQFIHLIPMERLMNKSSAWNVPCWRAFSFSSQTYG